MGFGESEPAFVFFEEYIQLAQFGQLEEISEMAIGIVKNRYGMDALFGRLAAAFEHVRLVRGNHEDIIRPEGMHGVVCNQRALSFNNPNQLCLLMPMQIRIEMREPVFLYGDSFVGRNGYSKLKCPHNSI